jgi:type II secretory pathway predicted ATPase ExeA/septal ring-binding cell division protein DamX
MFAPIRRVFVKPDIKPEKSVCFQFLAASTGTAAVLSSARISFQCSHFPRTAHNSATMYLEHFGLKHPPFRITPDQDFFYSGANRGAVLDALVYAVTQGEGIVKVVGEVGTGKTMLCRALVSRLPQNIDLIYLPNPSLPRDEILYAIADELGLPHLTDSKSTQVLREIQNHLIAKLTQGRQTVMIIDEAQATPLDTLEEIRLLSNLETDTSKLLQIVLFGQPELDQHLDLPHIRQLKERITHSFYLHPFERKEIDHYLAHRMATAGFRGPNIFSAGALRLLHKASQGLIRRINIFADKALLSAFSEGAFNVSARHVKAAIRDSSAGHGRAFSPVAWLALAALLSLGALAGALWFVQGRATAYSTPPAAAPATVPAPEKLSPDAAQTFHENPAEPVGGALAPSVSDQPRENQPLAPSVSVPPREIQNLGGKPPPTGGSGIHELSGPVSPEKAQPNPAQPEQAPSEQAQLEAASPSPQAAALAWLARQDGAHFTIQLMGVPPEAAESELQRLRAFSGFAAGPLYYYRTSAGGKPVANIISGSYPTLKEAMKEIAKLPPSFQQNQPLIRTFKGIRDEIGK